MLSKHHYTTLSKSACGQQLQLIDEINVEQNRQAPGHRQIVHTLCATVMNMHNLVHDALSLGSKTYVWCHRLNRHALRTQYYTHLWAQWPVTTTPYTPV